MPKRTTIDLTLCVDSITPGSTPDKSYLNLSLWQPRAAGAASAGGSIPGQPVPAAPATGATELGPTNGQTLPVEVEREVLRSANLQRGDFLAVTLVLAATEEPNG